MIEIDAKGLPCPRPLMETKKKLNEVSIGETINVIVDDKVPYENIIRYISTIGLTVKSAENSGVYNIEITKSKDIVSNRKSIDSKPVVVISSDCMGDGDKELGQLLMKGFVNTLPDVDILPKQILFYNSGVKLVAQNSDVLNSLKKMVIKGVDIMACGTCLDYYNLKDEIAIGSITNMFSIIDILSRNTNIVRP